MHKGKVKTYFIKTYGCQMNELDSEIMRGLLEKRGLQRAEEEEADLLVFNTCSIRDLAERKAMGKIGHIASHRHPRPIIGVTGCMANAKKESLFRKLPHIDFVLGTNNIHEFDAVLDEVVVHGKQALRCDRNFEHEIDYMAALRDDTVKAHVSIIRGCDKFCTYCVVPYTRGKEVSRPPQDIVTECRALVAKGYKEITVLGQNVNSYGKDQPQWGVLFHDLLAQIDAIEGLERLRFMTSHPYDITKELMQAVRDLKTVCEFVHFPLQAGSNRILRKMHRMYTVEEYAEKVAELRSFVPDVAIGTDIIVGFPTESDEDFAGTEQMMRAIRFAQAFIFEYSPRAGTPATRWKDDVPREVKSARLQTLLTLQEQEYAVDRTALIGKKLSVLVERTTEKDPTLLKARTRCWKNLVFPGDRSLIGTVQNVTVHGFSHQTLLAEKV